MGNKFIIKRTITKKPTHSSPFNNTIKNISDINTKEKVDLAEEILKNGPVTKEVKKIKKDKGLMEKKQMGKIILTEDNKELLND